LKLNRNLGNMLTETKESPSDVREQIIEAAREVFRRYGFRKATMDEIAARVGKQKGALYYYFPGKEELFKAILEKEANLFRQELVKAYTPFRKASDKLRAYVKARMLKIRQLANYYDAIKNDYLSHLSFINDVRSRFEMDETSIIQSFIYEGIVSGEFETKEPYLAAVAIVIAMKGLEEPLLINDAGPMEELENRIDHLLNILFYGIMKQA